MATFPEWNELPAEMHSEIRSQCCKSARILLALTCRKELGLLPPPVWPLKENAFQPSHIDLLMEQVPHTSRDQAIAALRKGHGGIVDAMVILSTEILVPPKSSILKLAYKEGHLSLVKCFQSNLFLPPRKPHYLQAFKYGHLHIVQWLTEKERLTLTLSEFKSVSIAIFTLAAYSGSIPMLNYLARLNLSDDLRHSEMTHGAMLGGHVPVLTWLFRLGKLSGSGIRYAICDRKFKWPISILEFFAQEKSPLASKRRSFLQNALNGGVPSLFIPDASKEWLKQNGFLGINVIGVVTQGARPGGIVDVHLVNYHQ